MSADSSSARAEKLPCNGPNHEKPLGVVFFLVTSHAPWQLEQSQFQPGEELPVSKFPFLMLFAPPPALAIPVTASTIAPAASTRADLPESFFSTFSSFRCWEK